uniref:BTB domain-containing protein n=1 Tax=Strongyloides papillosus TaxID=174720 RepID=A0A0N5CBE5_STREA
MALCKFYILDADGEEKCLSVMGVEKFDRNNDSCYLSSYIKVEELFLFKDLYLPNDILTMHFEIFYLLSCGLNRFGVSDHTIIETHSNMFLEDMTRMFDSPRFCDCIIKVRDSEIGVHKFILASRSEVFCSTLENKLTEHGSYIIEINDFRLEVVKEMINYLYTGRSPKIDELAFEMFEIGKKYKVEGLQLIATGSLLKSLNVENVCEYLEKSEIHSIGILQDFCIRYIYFKLDEVVFSEKWKKIVNFYPLLLEKVLMVTAGID